MLFHLTATRGVEVYLTYILKIKVGLSNHTVKNKRRNVKIKILNDVNIKQSWLWYKYTKGPEHTGWNYGFTFWTSPEPLYIVLSSELQVSHQQRQPNTLGFHLAFKLSPLCFHWKMVQLSGWSQQGSVSRSWTAALHLQTRSLSWWIRSLHAISNTSDAGVHVSSVPQRLVLLWAGEGQPPQRHRAAPMRAEQWFKRGTPRGLLPPSVWAASRNKKTCFHIEVQKKFKFISRFKSGRNFQANSSITVNHINPTSKQIKATTTLRFVLTNALTYKKGN